MPDLISKLFSALQERGWKMATAESCTGGMIAAALTDVSGSSSVFERGFVTYTNEAKMEMLGVPANILEQYGAVSTQTALAMVQGALKNSSTDLAVSVTGIAGPDGGSADKPVGLVYIGYGLHGKAPHVHEHHFKGDRSSVRAQTVQAALKHALSLLE